MCSGNTLRPVVIALISDTHLPRGARKLPDGCVERLRASDLIVHAGDFSTREVFDEIVALGPPVAAVHGNVDEARLKHELPEATSVDAQGANLTIVHDAGPATGRLNRLRKRFPQADAVVFGHSHIPLHQTSPDGGFQIFNPGSPTDRRRQPRHTMGLARAGNGSLTFELVTLD
jgi:hypothetical protein